MLADFPLLQVDLIVKRTIGSCVVLAVLAVAVAVPLGQPWAGLGVVLGLAGAVFNHRLFQVSTTRYSDGEGHLQRKPYAGSVALRLGALTVVAFALLFLYKPLGFGMIGGLLGFQLLLMANAFGALWRYQKAQLAGPAGATTGPVAGTEGAGSPLTRKGSDD